MAVLKASQACLEETATLAIRESLVRPDRRDQSANRDMRVSADERHNTLLVARGQMVRGASRDHPENRVTRAEMRSQVSQVLKGQAEDPDHRAR